MKISAGGVPRTRSITATRRDIPTTPIPICFPKRVIFSCSGVTEGPNPGRR
jgi:hypothetical protein